MRHPKPVLWTIVLLVTGVIFLGVIPPLGALMILGAFSLSGATAAFGLFGRRRRRHQRRYLAYQEFEGSEDLRASAWRSVP